MKNPMLHVRPHDEPQVYAAAELPWWSVFRINFSQLIALGTLLLALFGVWFRVQAHEREIEEIKANTQTKDAAQANTARVLERLDDLRARLDRIENRLDKEK